jgi:hypothetical protein
MIEATEKMPFGLSYRSPHAQRETLNTESTTP